MGAKAKLCGAALWLGLSTAGGAVLAEGSYNGLKDQIDKVGNYSYKLKDFSEYAFARKPVTVPHGLGGIAGLMVGLGLISLLTTHPSKQLSFYSGTEWK
jgi:hypothetical protein